MPRVKGRTKVSAKHQLTRVRNDLLAFALALMILWSIVGVARAAAATHHFAASRSVERHWASPPRSSLKPLTFSIYMNGREVDQLGSLVGACGYKLEIPGLTLRLVACIRGDDRPHPLVVLWESRHSFTISYSAK